jgi:hypothetical protein
LLTGSRGVRCFADWLAFWDSPHSIYVNARHKDVHYRLIAKEIAALVPGADTRVLDYGSGEALHANLVAEVAGELLLSEAAPSLCKAIAGHSPAKATVLRLLDKIAAPSIDKMKTKKK